jgi:hypothetical protein
MPPLCGGKKETLAANNTLCRSGSQNKTPAPDNIPRVFAPPGFSLHFYFHFLSRIFKNINKEIQFILTFTSEFFNDTMKVRLVAFFTLHSRALSDGFSL